MVPPHRGGKVLATTGDSNVMSAWTNMDFNLAAFREDRGELNCDVASFIEHFRGEADEQSSKRRRPN